MEPIATANIIIYKQEEWLSLSTERKAANYPPICGRKGRSSVLMLLKSGSHLSSTGRKIANYPPQRMQGTIIRVNVVGKIKKA